MPTNSENFSIAGLNFYADALETFKIENDDYNLPKSELIEEFEPYEKIWEYEYDFEKAELIPEPDNEHDPNAVAVVLDGEKIGYIKKGSCAHVKKLLESGDVKRIDVELHGGRYKRIVEDDEKQTVEEGELDPFGTVTIYVPGEDPAPVAPGVAPDPVHTIQPEKKRGALKLFSLVFGLLFIAFGLFISLVDKSGLFFIALGVVLFLYGIRK